MKYDEKKAIEIIEKYNLSKLTLKTWKRRGIPDKYFEADFVKRKTLSAKDKIRYNRLIEVSQMTHINTKLVCSSCNVKHQALIDAIRKQVQLSESDFLQLVGAINKLKIEIVKATQKPTPRTIRELLQLKELHLKPIFRTMPERELKRIYQFRDGKIELERQEIESIKNSLVIFALQLNI